jgi:tetratricopeptide (TPR) repeat protein
MLLSTNVKSQHLLEGNARIDSLHTILRDHKEDTGKVKILNDIAFEYNRISPYDGIKYGNESILLAKKLHWQLGIARGNSCLGANYFSLSDFPNAYKYWLIALEINEKIDNKIGVANHLHNIGNIFFSQKNYTQALEYYEKGLKSSEEIGNTKIITNSYTSIGKVYAQLKDYQKALEYDFGALNIDKKLDLKGNIAADEINIGSVYIEQGSYLKSLEILLHALQLKKAIGDKNGMANAYHLIGRTYLEIADKKIAEGTKQPDELQHAVACLDSAITIDKTIGYLDNMQKNYQYLSQAQEILNDHKAALASYKSYTAIKDSIFSLDKQMQIFNLEKKAEIEEQDRKAEIDKEAKERKEYIQIAGICAFIVILLFTLLLLRRKKVKTQIIDLLCTFSALVFFEFINLLLHSKIESFTDDNIVLTLLCLLVLASIIIPIHHKMEHWLKKKIGHK